MAFLAYDPNLDPNKKQQEQQQGPSNVSGASTTFDNQPPGSQAGKPKTSGQFTNIQAYLNANKEQATQMGSQVAGRVEQGAQEAQTNIGKFANEKQTVNTVNPNQYLANPAAANKTEYQALRQTGGYSGPDAIDKTQNYQAAAQSAQKATDLVKASGTEDGRMNLLQETYKRPTYSRGQQKLDQVLMQNDAASKDRFADINQKYSNISSMFDNTANEVGNSINQAKQTAAQNKQALLAAETQARKDLIDPIQKRAQDAYANNTGLIDRVNADLSDDVLSEETLANLGLAEDQSLFDLSLGSYLTPDRTQVGLDNVATADERSRYTALAALLDDPTMSQITANGKSITPISFNKDQFTKDLGTKQTEYQAATKQITDEMDKLIAQMRATKEAGSAFGSSEDADQKIAELEARKAAALAANDKSYGVNRKIKKG